MNDVTQQTFQIEVIAASHRIPVLVDFWAPWCAPCRALGPVLEKIENDQAGQFKLVKINSDENQELAAALGVRGIPNVVLFKDGRPIDQFVGALPEAKVREFLARHVEKPGDHELATAREAMQEKRWGAAAEAFAVVLAINPADQGTRADYVLALIRLGRFEQARTVWEPLRGPSRADLRLAAIGRLLDAAEHATEAPDEDRLRASVAEAPDDPARRMALADWLFMQSRWADAMDELLVVAGRHRRYGDDIARRTMLAIFELCGDPALASVYRRKLSASLF